MGQEEHKISKSGVSGRVEIEHFPGVLSPHQDLPLQLLGGSQDPSDAHLQFTHLCYVKKPLFFSFHPAPSHPLGTL